MKARRQTLANFARFLAGTCPPELMRLERLEIFEGPSPFAPCPAIIFSVEAAQPQLTAAELYGRLHAAFPAYFDTRTCDLPGAETGPGQVATQGKATADEVDAFVFKWKHVGKSSKHITFDWSGPDAS